MTSNAAAEWSGDFMDEDLRGLALILEYATEQAQKLALNETTALVAKARQTLEDRLAAAKGTLHTARESDPAVQAVDTWQTPEFLGGPIILDDVA